MDSENKISRRSMLKKAGLVGAVAWSAPVLTSLATPAGAAPLRGSRKCTTQDRTGGTAACHFCTPPTCPGTQCGFCFPTTTGCCFCTNNFFCNNVSNCTNRGQCPPGWECGYTC